MSRIVDLTGKKFGRLIVIKKVGKNKFNNVLWECQCNCGNKKVTISTNLINGICKSCGCLHKEGNRKKHNMSNTRIYNTWHNMIERCYNKKCNEFKNYGGRGIKVYKYWQTKNNGFENFYNWAIKNNYNDNLTIDRINNNGNYTPKNCRWVTMKEQANNRSNNLYIEYKGNKKTLKEWSNELGISYNCLRHRLYRNWTIEKALTEPENKQYNKKK